MQKQEIKSKRRSRELEGPESWREHRAMINHHDRRAARERQVCLNMWLGIQDKDKHIHRPVMHMCERSFLGVSASRGFKQAEKPLCSFQVQRERLDSEGLPSPTEDCSPENLPPSPTTTTP